MSIRRKIRDSDRLLNVADLISRNKAQEAGGLRRYRDDLAVSAVRARDWIERESPHGGLRERAVARLARLQRELMVANEELELRVREAVEAAAAAKGLEAKHQSFVAAARKRAEAKQLENLLDIVTRVPSASSE